MQKMATYFIMNVKLVPEQNFKWFTEYRHNDTFQRTNMTKLKKIGIEQETQQSSIK